MPSGGVLLLGGSGTGKSTAHKDKIALDLEELECYRARKRFFEWNNPGEEVRRVRGDYYVAARDHIIKSDIPIVSVHPGDFTHTRQAVVVYSIPDFKFYSELTDKGAVKFTRERLMAAAMGYARSVDMLKSDEVDLQHVHQGYVSEVVDDHYSDYILSEDAWDEMIDSLTKELDAVWSDLDEKHQFTYDGTSSSGADKAPDVRTFSYPGGDASKILRDMESLTRKWAEKGTQTAEMYYSKLHEEYNEVITGDNDPVKFRDGVISMTGDSRISEVVTLALCSMHLLRQVLHDSGVDATYNLILSMMHERYAEQASRHLKGENMTEKKDTETPEKEKTPEVEKSNKFTNKSTGTRYGFLGAKKVKSEDGSKVWETKEQCMERLSQDFHMDIECEYVESPTPGWKAVGHKPKKRNKKKSKPEGEASDAPASKEKGPDGVKVVEAKNEKGQTAKEAMAETQADHPDAKVIPEDPDMPPLAEPEPDEKDKTVAELKKELEAKGLPTSGNKAELQKRLEENA